MRILSIQNINLVKLFILDNLLMERDLESGIFNLNKEVITNIKACKLF